MNGTPGGLSGTVPTTSTPTTTTRTPSEELKATDRIYISTQGDWWDTIAMRCYGMRRGNEHLMYRLLEANYFLRNVGYFPAGVHVIVPQVEVVTEIPLVPWKKTEILSAPQM